MTFHKMIKYKKGKTIWKFKYQFEDKEKHLKEKKCFQNKKNLSQPKSSGLLFHSFDTPNWKLRDYGENEKHFKSIKAI